MAAHASEVSRFTTMYLDQWVWIRLARARLSRFEAIPSRIRDQLVSARLQGTAAFPLSEAHYLETWKQGKLRRRSELAVEMGLLSGFLTLAPMRNIWPQELDQALHERFGRPQVMASPPVFGHGVSFAFGQSDVQPNVTSLDLEQRFLFEWEVLRSPDESRFSVDDHERRSKAARFADIETTESWKLKSWPVSDQERAQRFRVQTLTNLDVDFYGRLIAADISPEELGALGGEGLEALVRAVPTLWVLTELRRLRYANPSQGFKPSDLYDLRALAVAIVYCDVVIADRAWVHVLQGSDLPERYGTVVAAKLEHVLEA